MARGYDYSRWDGTQALPDLDGDWVLDELTDDLLYHGDLNAAMRRLMHQGARDRDGNDMMGMREILDRIRQRREESLDRFDLGGVYGDIADELRDVLDTEREALDRLAAQAEQARDAGDERRAQAAADTAATKRMELDMLPPDLAGQVQGLQDYDFTSSAAQAKFDELMDKLRQELVDSFFRQVSSAMADVSPEAMQRTKDMLAELNEMLEQRARGDEPDFDGFMERYGDMFPENPQNLDELLEAMARRMAAMQSMMASMTPEQRAQLQALSDQLLEDMDLRWQMDQLGRNLQQAFPDAGWGQSYDFRGQDPMDMAQATDLMAELGDLDSLEQLLRSAADPGALSEVDAQRAREMLGEDAAESLERMSEIARRLEESGYAESREGRLQLTPKAMRRIGQNALSELFAHLTKDRAGRHEDVHQGPGHERAYATKPFEWGDPFNLSIEQTVRNAVSRQGSGTPIQLQPDDFEVERTEHVTRSATVLLVDLSLSMEMRGTFLAAKKVAMALHALISSQFPRDYLGIVGFSRSAREVKAADLPEVSWDFEYGTNMQHALMIARRMLGRQSGNRQVMMITDGEPTAHLEPGFAEPFFHYPPLPETVDATLREVLRCTRDDIRINTFMLYPDPGLERFIEELTRMNSGRMFTTDAHNLGAYVLVDFVEHRRRLLGGRARA